MKVAHVVTLLVCSFYLAKAQACRGPSQEMVTYLEKLPGSAMTKPVVARIEIISVAPNEDHQTISKVRVVKAIKGTKTGATLEVVTEMHSCNGDPKLSPGEFYFIAGKIDKGVFRGEWQRSNL